MIVVIQSSPERRPDAGRIQTKTGQPVLFVADPAKAPNEPGVLYARPDGRSQFHIRWRDLVVSYSAHSRNNPLGLLPAHKLYRDEIYAQLVRKLGEERVFVLSPGWGLISASFLTPDYDITFDAGAEPHRRRLPTDEYADFCMLPAQGEEYLYFFGDGDCLGLFSKLTKSHPGARIVFHPEGSPPEAAGCETRPFKSEGQPGWHLDCARDFLSSISKTRTEKARQPAPRVSGIEARLKSLRSLRGTNSLRTGDKPTPAAATVKSTLQRAKSHLDSYQQLMDLLLKVDVAKDEEFQQRFITFHRITHRSPAWLSTYFHRLEVAKVIGAEFADVMDELWEETGRYDPAYASRLVATADPGKPVWDRFTLSRTGLRAPAYVDPNKLQNSWDVYRQIREWYADYLESQAGQRLVALFDEAAPGFGNIAELKKVEFALLPAGHFSSIAVPAASISHSA